jgi:hypothetical protein
MRRILLLACGLLPLTEAAEAAGTTFRDDRLSLNGTWKFDLRRDNQLTGSGPVSFGPVSASSQAVMISPWPGETAEGRWRTVVPWLLSATIVRSGRCSARFVAGDFLGKFDTSTIDLRLKAGDRFGGGFCIFRLDRTQSKALAALPAARKDLTWPRPASAGGDLNR